MPRSNYFTTARAVARRACAALTLLLLAATGVQAQTPSVFIEDLTWPELRARVASGAVVAIVPTGGTEQGGPHLALGKHNFIVRLAAGRIAEELGNALVAPVIPVVPEGPLDKPSDNLLFPGTLGLADDTFALVLRDIATSLAISGFKVICFVGDHGQSQATQERLATQLDAAWKALGIRVLNIASYYSPEAQDRMLARDGVPREALGEHGGVGDTAQLWAARPDAVRPALRAPEEWKGPGPSGASGRPELATQEMGVKLLRQKVDDAVAEIRRRSR